MVRTVTTKQAALARARERRLALDAQRDARDRRVEELTAEALLLLDQRASAEAVVAETNMALRAALQQLLAEGTGLDGAAALLDLDPGEVRRLVRAANLAGSAALEPSAAGPRESDGVELQSPPKSRNATTGPTK